MDKLITKLSAELASELSVADEIFIAVALLNDAGLDFLLKDLKDNCKINLLVGIDLPTTPEVLKRLLELKDVNTRIYSKIEYFHPKLYVLKIDGKLKIFVGSSNFTKGGLNDNIELSVFSIDESACNDALNWFSEVFDSSSILSKEFLDVYETLFLDREIYREIEKKNVKKIKGLLKPPTKEAQLDLLSNEYFFVKNDYLTFHEDKITKETTDIENERLRVRGKMLRLENLLCNEIKREKWKIYTTSTNDGVSLIKINAKRKYINSIWLHFGKRGAEKGLGTFIENIRLQVIIAGDLRLSGGYGIGTWLMVGKKFGSLEDRAYIKKNLGELSFQSNFYNLIKGLGNGYFIKVNDISKPCSSFNQDTFIDFVKKDEPENYFIIGKDFEPNDNSLLKDNIVGTIMTEFSKLYPIYLLLKFK